MAEIRNLTRNGETFYPLTTSSAVINESTGEGLIIDDEPTAGSNNLVKSGGVDKIINGTSVIDGTSFESPKWYSHTAVGEPLTLNTSYNYTYAYKGLIPQGTVSIDIFGSGYSGGRLWYTLDTDENVVRMSNEVMKSDRIVIQDGEVYIVVQTNDVVSNPGKIIFYNSDGINQKIDGINQKIKELRNKLIKLAKWGSAGNPTDLSVGDVYTGDGTNLIQVDEITSGAISRFTLLPFLDGAIYTYNNELYVYNGTELVKDNKINSVTAIKNVMPYYSEAFDEWQPNTSYSVDDKRSWGGYNYICITAHTSGNSFNRDYWQYCENSGNDAIVVNGLGIGRYASEEKLIKLEGIGSLSYGTSGITKAGQYYFNIGNNTLYKCRIFNTTPINSTFDVVPLYDSAIYVFGNQTYVFNGVTLVNSLSSKAIPYGDALGGSFDGKNFTPRNVALDENYGLKQGYFYTNGFVLDTARVSTKLINVLNKDVKVKVASSSFEIRGYMRFNSDYTYVDYISELTDRKSLTLPKGYYYSVVFNKLGGGDFTPDEIAPYIWIDDRIILNELNTSTAPFIDTIINVGNIAETDTWYTGYTIGEELTKTSYNGAYAVTVPVSESEVYQFSAKGATGGRGWYYLDSERKVVDCSAGDFNATIVKTIPSGVAYLLIQSNSGLSYLSLVKYGKVDKLELRVDELENNVQELNNDVELIYAQESFKCNTPFLWNKLSRLKNLPTGFCNIGFIGDSWTQGTEDSIVQGKYEGYVKHLTNMLQDEYGYGGLGWLDFARDGGTGKMFGCAEMYESWSYAFAGNVTGVDAAGSPSTPAAQCFGICVAHTIFGNTSSLTLNFNAGILDKFVLRYYKNAHFNVSVNGGAAVEVTANSTDGWQETEFGTTGTDTTSVVITSLADDSIIFGMDCFYGNHGVRVHKIGNRSITAAHYLGMDATQWETGISKLNLSWASVLLAINDLGSSTSESTMDTIVTRIGTLIDRLKVATDNGNGLVTCDINLLGVDNIEASGWTGLGRLAEKQKEFALNNGYGWCSTDKCIGSKKTEFTYNGTFSDTIHLNKIGSYAYAKHIYNSLFKF